MQAIFDVINFSRTASQRQFDLIPFGALVCDSYIKDFKT